MQRRYLWFVVPVLVLCAALLAATGCRVSEHEVGPAALGAARSTSALENLLATPGPVLVESVVGAHWEVPRSGLVNLDHPKAKAAGLVDGPEPIQIYFHALVHPTRGLYIVDTGVERALRDDPERAVVRGVVARVMNVQRMKIQNDLGSWLARQKQPLAGVLLTHLHLDHLTGMPDVPRGTPIFVGPGETRVRGIENLVVRPVVDRALAGHVALSEWRFEPDPDGRFSGVIDVFGDGSLWALWVGGHTPGSVAYLARTPTGPVLMVGDACHTAWGWENGVEPGSFSHDQPASAESLDRLKQLVARHPSIDVRLGHQRR